MRSILCLALLLLAGSAMALDDTFGYGDATTTSDAYNDGSTSGYDNLDGMTEQPEEDASLLGTSSFNTTKSQSDLLPLDQSSSR